MSSSTSRRGSFDGRLLITLFAGIVGAPLLWLMTMQTGYVLAYQACDTRSTTWVLVPTVAAVGIVGALTWIVAAGHRRAERDRPPMPLLGWLGIGMAVMMVIVLAASVIAPAVLHPCD